MGTPSLTRICDEDGDAICAMYGTFDGNISDHGMELAKFMDGFQIMHGLPLGASGKIANGAGCFAAQLIAHFKTEPGGFYITSTDHEEEDYIYDITVLENGLMVQVFLRGLKVFAGNVPAFKQFCSATKE